VSPEERAVLDAAKRLVEADRAAMAAPDGDQTEDRDAALDALGEAVDALRRVQAPTPEEEAEDAEDRREGAAMRRSEEGR